MAGLGLLLLIHAYPVCSNLVSTRGGLTKIAAAGDYEERMRGRWGAFSDTMFQVRLLTPPNALVVLPPQSSGYGALGNRGLCDYFLFPRTTSHAREPSAWEHDGPVYAVIPDGLGHDVPGRTVGSLSTNATLYLVQEGAIEAHGPADFTRTAPRGGRAAHALVRLLFLVGVGWGISYRLLELKTWPGRLALSLLMGCTVWSLVFLAASCCGLALSSGWQTALLGGMAFVAVPALRVPGWSWPKGASLVAGLTVALFFLHLFTVSASLPIREWDACAIWGIKAKALYAFGDLSALKGWGAWPEYPPLFPIYLATLAVGGEVVVKLGITLLGVVLFGLLYEALRGTRFPVPARLLLAAVPFLAGLFYFHAKIAYANLIFTAFVTATLLVLRLAVTTRQQRAWMACSLIATGMVLTRPEGEVLLLYMVVAAWWVMRRASVSASAWRWLLIPIGANVAWKMFYTVHVKGEVGSSWFGVASQGQLLAKLGLTKLPWSGGLLDGLAHFALYSLSPHVWGMLMVAFVVFALLRGRVLWKAQQLEVVFLMMGMLGLFVLAAYLGPHWGLDYFFHATYTRMLMPFVPVAYLLTLGEVERWLMTTPTFPKAAG